MEDPSGSGGWRFAQCFGDKGEVEDITEGSFLLAFSIVISVNYLHNRITADIISTVEFDSTGNYLATGDKGGRVVLFERNEMVRFSQTCQIGPFAGVFADPSLRKKAVNTSFTRSSSPMNPSLTT